MDTSKGEKVTAKAHGGQIDIQGITIAKVNEGLQLQSVEVWFDPLEMFRQIALDGVVNKILHNPIQGQDLTSQLHGEETVDDEELEATHAEMSSITPAECPFMNHE